MSKQCPFSIRMTRQERAKIEEKRSDAHHWFWIVALNSALRPRKLVATSVTDDHGNLVRVCFATLVPTFSNGEH